jgi:peroxiredoxin
LITPPVRTFHKSQTNGRHAHTEWANKKVVLFAVPGAFTPGCSVKHLPGYIQNLPALKAKGVDIVAVIAYNDAFVMSAWSKANGIKNDDIVRPNPLSWFFGDIGCRGRAWKGMKGWEG